MMKFTFVNGMKVTTTDIFPVKAVIDRNTQNNFKFQFQK